MQLCHARSALSTLLKPLPVAQRKAAEGSIRPLDELDKARLDTWETAAMLRPRIPKDDATAPASTLKQFLAELSDSEDESVDGAPLAITDGRIEAGDAGTLDETLALEGWRHIAETRAVVVLLNIGNLEKLTYIRCHREERRVALLVSRLGSLPDLAETVAIAAGMAKDGALPPPSGPRARKTEFLKRCQAALVIRNPKAETEVKLVPKDDQRKIAVALSPAQICSRCPAPAATSMEFGLAWLDGVPEPSPDERWYCKGCLPSHPAVCITCGKPDDLEVTGGASAPAPFVGFHLIPQLRCTRCLTGAVAPMSIGEKRAAAAEERSDLVLRMKRQRCE
jgi:hypothetical protein